MDECAARLQPLVDQYKPIQNQIFAIEKFRDLIVTTRSIMSWEQKNLFLKKCSEVTFPCSCYKSDLSFSKCVNHVKFFSLMEVVNEEEKLMEISRGLDREV